MSHQHGLQLAADQDKPVFVSENLTCWVTGDQLSTGEDTGQKRADRAANTMDRKGVERIIEPR